MGHYADMRRAVLLVPLFLLPFTGTAKAETAEQVAAALRTSPVFQSKGLDLVDVATLTAELQGSDPKLDLAVLAQCWQTCKRRKGFTQISTPHRRNAATRTARDDMQWRTRKAAQPAGTKPARTVQQRWPNNAVVAARRDYGTLTP